MPPPAYTDTAPTPTYPPTTTTICNAAARKSAVMEKKRKKKSPLNKMSSSDPIISTLKYTSH